MKKRISLTTIISVLLVSMLLLAGCTTQETSRTTIPTTAQSTTSPIKGSLSNNVYKVTMSFTAINHCEASTDPNVHNIVYQVTTAITIDFPECSLDTLSPGKMENGWTSISLGMANASGNFKCSGWARADWESWQAQDSYEGVLGDFAVCIRNVTDSSGKKGVSVNLTGPSFKYFSSSLNRVISPNTPAGDVLGDLCYASGLQGGYIGNHLFNPSGETVNFEGHLMRGASYGNLDYSGTLTLVLVR